jgi:hypothetical protein
MSPGSVPAQRRGPPWPAADAEEVIENQKGPKGPALPLMDGLSSKADAKGQTPRRCGWCTV